MFSIPKLNNDPQGLEFEQALIKARYVYPSPDNPDAQSIEQHAKQIYESELVERSICGAWPDLFKPLTYYNVMVHFEGNKLDRLLRKMSPYKLTKTKKQVQHVREVFEYQYEFCDIFHVPSLSIIECKVYVSEASLRRHKEKIRSKRRDQINDFYLLSKKEDNYFIPDHFLTVNNSGQFVRQDFEEFVNGGV